jgi:hypothetical protein
VKAMAKAESEEGKQLAYGHNDFANVSLVKQKT